jgi:hypothetical protein
MRLGQTGSAMRLRLFALIAALIALAAPVRAENTVPSAQLQEILIKTSLLTLNDANITGNYAVLHAKLAKPFRDQFTPERLKAVFKSFADQKLDFGLIAAKPPVAAGEATIDSRGALHLHGYFDTRPSRLTYDLDFLPSEGEWKPIKLNIDLKPVQGN